MNKDYLLKDLVAADGSAFESISLSDTRDTIEDLINTTLHELKENEIIEAASVENAINDYSVII